MFGSELGRDHKDPHHSGTRAGDSGQVQTLVVLFTQAVPHHPELRMASRDFAASWSVTASPENPQPNVFSKSRAALHPPSKFRDMGRTGSQPPKSIRKKGVP